MPGFRRKKLFIHASSQGKYIAFSILPALLMGLFCIGFIYTTGEQVLLAAKEKPMVPVYEIQRTLMVLKSDAASGENGERIDDLALQLNRLTDVMERGYEETVLEWNGTRTLILTILACGLFLTAILALFSSHRIAGPLVRIGNSIELMAAGKKLPPIRLRKHDEYRHLADSLERLRRVMDEADMLE